MPVSVLSEEVDPPQRAPLRLVPPAEEPAPLIDDALRMQMVAILAAASQVLAARLILLLAVLGAVGLAAVVVWRPSIGGIFATGVFDLFVLVPLTMLAWRKG